VKSFCHVYGLPGVCLRYFNVFGPKQSADSPYSGVIARFISDMLQASQPTIFGDGSQSRDFTYIANVVSANLLACFAPDAEVAGEVFNIGTGSSQTLNALYHSLAKLLNWSGPAKYAAPRSGDIEHSEADIAKAKRMLGYVPLVSFNEGLRVTTDWYLSQASHFTNTPAPNPIQSHQFIANA
jgi:UDP-glucose 4-epimerase